VKFTVAYLSGFYQYVSVASRSIGKALVANI